LEGLQQNIKKFRPWFDESVRSLTILKRLTEAFPEDGSVTAKTIEIRESSGATTVTCTGTARESLSLLRMRDKLSSAPGVNEVHIEQTRGKSPLQFTFNFHWNEAGASKP